ncbi:hypothetical protein [Lachnospira pectinoschiza]|uniref:Uncharacterized protein n=1 Tax=Lachnospira pectinoschiza TaxID=28052 RepID=A0A1G9WYT4_9FIRM|nr:hypothetical protein [Lachnospira pectinoschiza]SDM89619.1 hypothetical protein SAMN05216544_1397 [Lachnospira pectinoschiza]
MNGLLGLKFSCVMPSVLHFKTFKALDLDLSKYLGIELEYEIKKAKKEINDNQGLIIKEGSFYLEINTVGYNTDWNTDTIAIAIAVIKRHLDLKIFGEFIIAEDDTDFAEGRPISDEEYDKMIKDLAKKIVGKHI